MLFFMAGAPSGGTGAGGGMNQVWPNVILFGSIFAIMYFMMIRPQQKRAKETQNMLNSITTGDRVITASGIHGTIKEVNTDDNTFMIQIAENVKIKVEKSAVVGKKH